MGTTKKIGKLPKRKMKATTTILVLLVCSLAIAETPLREALNEESSISRSLSSNYDDRDYQKKNEVEKKEHDMCCWWFTNNIEETELDTFSRDGQSIGSRYRYAAEYFNALLGPQFAFDYNCERVTNGRGTCKK